MSDAADFLVEIGTEELPPKALRSLMEAFGANLEAAVDESRLARGNVHVYASPRRLAVMIESLADGQEDRKKTQKGPPVTVAFDKDGNMTAAATAFAKKCGVDPDDLGRTKTSKGEWLSCDVVEKGKPTSELMPELIERSLASLPIPRRMRWGAGEAEFVRPVHWVVLLHGSKVLDARVMGIAAGNESHGHRFHSSAPVAIKAPSDYLGALEKRGHVIADFARRRDLVREGVEAQAEAAGGVIVNGDSLYDEVTALVEWPVSMTGGFDDAFLRLPRECVVSTLTSHQRYFPVADEHGELLPKFVFVSNLDSQDPDQVRDGNERVILPRLADAAFFWDQDRRTTLASRQERLHDVVYQRGLGSLFDRSERIATIATSIAAALEADGATAARAAQLSKCDLLTGMVGEFPELQGTMGRYYAISDSEPQAVADAIGEQYLPKHAGDALPSTAEGQVLAVADKLDMLAGVFSIGKKPSGNRDPFGLRRAALGIVRILIERGIDIDLKAAISEAVTAQPKGKIDDDELCESLYAFITERLRRYYLDADDSLATETFDAVLARQPASLVDFDRRLSAVQAFVRLEPAESLAAANKRIANILRQAEYAGGEMANEKLLTEGAEKALWSAISEARAAIGPMIEKRDYAATLTNLAELRPTVDSFFDDVMVMVDDESVKNNRLAVLAELRALFLEIADISRLSV